MEKSELWSKQKTADFLFSEMVDDPKKRKEKLNNWINRNRIPKKCMDKIGNEVIFFGDVIKEWLKERKQQVA
jgi:hypothetical protein